MFNKKQFMIVLVSAVFVFAIIFTTFYAVFYKRGIQNPIVQPEATVPVVSVPEAPHMTTPTLESEPEGAMQVRIRPSTHVFVKMVDPSGNRVTEQKLPVDGILGFTKEQVAECFVDYQITVFTQEQVILEKVVAAPVEQVRYTLTLKGDQIGIKSSDLAEGFVSLGLSVKDYSRTTQTLLLDEIIEITPAQKDALEQNPNEIEKILQDYSE